jgi:hypothetical protein
MRPFTVSKAFYQPEGLPPTSWDKRGCIAIDVSPAPPTWGEGGCPAGTVEYAPWSRIPFEIGARREAYTPNYPGAATTPASVSHDFRACKTRAQLCAESIPARSMLKAYPLCKGWPGPDPDVSWITGKASDCGPGVVDLPRVETNPCPPGFEKFSDHKDGNFFMCRETAETHAMRVAAWRMGCPSAYVAPPPKPLEEVSSGAILPEDIEEHFVPDPIDQTTKVEIGGMKMSPLVIVAIGAALAFLLFGGKR